MSTWSPSVLAERPWSPSKGGALQKCLRAYHYSRRLRLSDGPASSEARIGTAVHAVFEWALRDDLPDEAQALAEVSGDTSRLPPTVVPVPAHTATELDERLPYLLSLFAQTPRNGLNGEELAVANGLLPRVKSFALAICDYAAKEGVTEFHLEHRAAFDVDLRPVAYDDKTALMRGIMDFGFATPRGVYVVIDHKTGTPQPLDKYGDQLAVYKLLVLAYHPEVMAVQCGINHVRRSKVDWAAPETRTHIEREVAPWLAHHLGLLGMKLDEMAREARPRITPLCNWCGYADMTWPRWRYVTPHGVPAAFVPPTEYEVHAATRRTAMCPEGAAEIVRKPLGRHLKVLQERA